MPVSPWKGLLESPLFLDWLDIFVAKFNTVESDLDTAETAIDSIESGLSGLILGCAPSNAADTDHDLTFTAGKYFNGTTVYTLPTYTKQFDAAFAEGTNAGGVGAALPTSGAYYIFAISKDSSPSTVDYFGDTDSGGANVPSGWTVLKEVLRLMTDASENFFSFFCEETSGGGLKVTYDVQKQEFADANPGASRQDKTLAYVPPNTEGFFVAGLIDTSADANIQLVFTRKDQVDTAPSTSVHHLRIQNAGGLNVIENSILRLRTNSSRVVCYRLSASDSGTVVRLNTEGYILERT